eukprot:g7116.t1
MAVKYKDQDGSWKLGNLFASMNFVLIILIFANTHTDTHAGTYVVYRQPSRAVDIPTSVFVNPKTHPGGWPRNKLDNHTCSVFWQRDHLNATIITPVPSVLEAKVSKFTGIAGLKPEEEAICCHQNGVANNAIPWSAVQYSKNGIYGSAINTSGAKEALTTNTIETSFGKCLNVWEHGSYENGFEVELELAVPTAFKKFATRDDCAVYASLSVNIQTKPNVPNHFIWYETKFFDFERDVIDDHVFIDTVSQKLIIASPLSGTSKYHVLLSNSSKSSNKTWNSRRYFGYKVKAEHLEHGIIDGLKKFPSHFPQSLPKSASDYCITGFNLELEATPDAGAGLNVKQLQIKIIRDESEKDETRVFDF